MDSNRQRLRAPVFKTGSFPIRIISVIANDWNRTSFVPSSAARVDHNHHIGMARRPRFERGPATLEVARLPLPHRRMEHTSRFARLRSGVAIRRLAVLPTCAWSRQQELNPQPIAYKAIALPIEL
jgi:hypothetical protein